MEPGLRTGNGTETLVPKILLGVVTFMAFTMFRNKARCWFGCRNYRFTATDNPKAKNSRQSDIRKDITVIKDYKSLKM